MSEKICLNCRNHVANRPRGLCYSCYYRPGVRDLYPAASNQWGGSKKDPNHGSGALPEVPTKACPGTPEKLAVLHSRASRGLSLFHPDDFSIGQAIRFWGVWER